MKEIFLALAKYNAVVNRDMLGFVRPLDREKVFRDMKTYHKNIFAVLTHIMYSDLAWLRRIQHSMPGRALGASVLVAMPQDALNKRHEEDYTVFFSDRNELDAAISGFIDECSGDGMKALVKYRAKDGSEREYELWKILLQMFNHDTHHRSQVSIMLELLGVENDYSTLLLKI